MFSVNIVIKENRDKVINRWYYTPQNGELYSPKFQMFVGDVGC